MPICLNCSSSQSGQVWRNIFKQMALNWETAILKMAVGEGRWPVSWCSGYHVCFTRRRSRVRSSPKPGTFEYVRKHLPMLKSVIWEWLYKVSPCKLTKHHTRTLDVKDVTCAWSLNSVPIFSHAQLEPITDVQCVTTYSFITSWSSAKPSTLTQPPHKWTLRNAADIVPVQLHNTVGTTRGIR